MRFLIDESADARVAAYLGLLGHAEDLAAHRFLIVTRHLVRVRE
jgi:hypothetical protein